MSIYILLLSILSLSGASVKCPDEIALSVTAPWEMEALSGSCLQIPCHFTTQGETDTSFKGVWMIKDPRFDPFPENVIYNESKPESPYPMKFNGKLSERNCSTLFSNLTSNYTDKYFFRVEKTNFKATAICQPLFITVKDSLRPEVNVSGETLENRVVNISCSAATPCPQSPPTLTWNLQQPSGIIREQNEDGTSTSKIQATVTLSHQHDGLTINCSASYPVNEGTMKTSENMTLNVKYTPKNTTAWVSPSAVVSAGTFVNLSCSSRANPPVSGFTWFRISTDGARNVSEGDLYNFNVTEGGEYYCVARNQLGNETSGKILISTLIITGFHNWLFILGGVAGILIFVSIGVCVWRVEHKRSSPLQSVRSDQKTTEEAEEVHYGEIDFSKRTVNPKSEEGQEQQQDTVYSQVNVRKSADD